MKKPLVYVAGPITGDPFGCVRQSVHAFDTLRALGCVPFCSQWSVIAEMVEHQPYEDWMAYDFDVIERCDALVRLEGESPGADREVDEAQRLGLPVFGLKYGGDIQAIIRWVADWTASNDG